MNDYFTRVEQQLVREVEARAAGRTGTRTGRWPRPRLRLDLAIPALATVVAVAVAVVFLSVHTHRALTPATPQPGTEVVYRVEPTPQVPHVTHAVLVSAAAGMRARLATRDLRRVTVRLRGRDEIAVSSSGLVSRTALVDASGIGERLVFYDWESNVLVPDGHTVASQLRKGNRRAIEISQGQETTAPGASSPSSGGLPLLQALRIAARQPRASLSPHQTYLGNEYFLLGRAGGSACATLARDDGAALNGSGPCLLDDPPLILSARTPKSAVRRRLQAALPAGVSLASVRKVVIKQGTVVLEGVPTSFSQAPSYGSPAARYYVLRDDAAVFGNQVTDVEASTDQSGNPDVTFDFDHGGGRAFQALTATIAQRGRDDSVGKTLYQHFAIALGDRLITVPYIDFTANPDGIPGSIPSEITGSFTRATARSLVDELRLDALTLRPIGTR